MTLEMGDIDAVEGGMTAEGRQHTDQGFHQGGLAHAIAAHHSDNFPGLNREVDPVEHFTLAIGDVVITDSQHTRAPQCPR